MATDPNQQSVYLSGIDSSIPAWASEQTSSNILKAITSGDNKLYGQSVNQTNATNNMAQMLTRLVNIMSGDKSRSSTSAYLKSVQQMQKDMADIKSELQALNTNIKNGVSTSNNNNNNNNGPRDVVTILSGIQAVDRESKKELKQEFSKLNKGVNSQVNYLKKYLKDNYDISLSMAEIKGNLSTIKSKLDISDLNTGGPLDALGGLGEFMGKANAITSGMKAMVDAAVTAYSTVQVPFEMIMQQVKDRFEITTELRQSGLLEDLGATFVDTTKAFSDNNMTIKEATQFVREFSNAVGVMGTNSALQFVNKMAYSTNMMDRFGLNFSQVAKISGTYLDTLERTGMLEQISASDRDRGMRSFMNAVEDVSMTLKTSLEESAKMIKEYLSRDDVAAMLMTNMDNLSQEVVANIGAMSKMGPMGEIIAKGAIDPARFALTQEYQALNNPALSGIRSIIDQMMLELRSGRASDELIAQYGQQMSDILKNDPLVGQLVVMDDSVAKIVAGVGQLAQTSQDATNNILIPSVDQAERRRQDMERLRAKTVEATLASVIKTLDNSRALEGILNDQTKIIETQIEAIDKLSTNAADFMADIVVLGAQANVLLNQTIADFAKGVADLFPEHHMAGQYQDMSVMAETGQQQMEVDIADIISGRDGGTGINRKRADEILSAAEDTEYSNWFRNADSSILWIDSEIEASQKRIQALEDQKATMTDPAEIKLIDRLIIGEQENITSKTISDSLDTIGDRMQETMGRNTGNTYYGHRHLAENATDDDKKEEHRRIIRESALESPEVIQGRLQEVLAAVSELDAPDEIKYKYLAQDAVNAMHETYLAPEDMKSIIEEMFTDPQLISMLGNTADEFKSALLADLPDVSDLSVLSDKLKSDQEFIKLTGNNTDKILTAIDEKIAINPNMSPNSLLASLRSDPSFTQMTDGNADAIITAIQNKLTPSETIVEPTPVTVEPTPVTVEPTPVTVEPPVVNVEPTPVTVEPPVVNVVPPTETIKVEMPIDPSLMTALRLDQAELANDSISSEIYGKIEESLGDSTDNQFSSSQFNDFVKELQDDRNLTKSQMLELLTKIEETISKNRPKVEEMSGSTDVSRLVGSLGLLIDELKGK